MSRRSVVVVVVLGVVACGAPSGPGAPGTPGAPASKASPTTAAPSTMACEGTSVVAGSTAYCVMTTRRPFDNAKQDCERMHGRLATFRAGGSDRALFEKIASPWGYGSGLWLGCSDTEQEGKWTCGGKPMTFASWAPGQPDSGDALEDCAEWLSDTGHWNDAPCSWALGYICRGDASMHCDGRKVTSGATTFCASATPKDWDGAKQACAAAGGSLAAPLNADESAALFASLKLPSAIPSLQPQQGVWIGLGDEAEEGKFKWVDGTPLGTGNWAAGQPDDRGDQDCVTLTLTDGRWADETCGTPLPYVCEPQ